MKYSFIYIGVLLLSAAACHQHPPSAPTATNISTGDAPAPAAGTDSKNFFPVTDYILSEIGYVDSTPLAILKYTIQDGHSDSTFIKPDEFHRLAKEFMLPEFAKDSVKRQYAESSFIDSTTGYMTLNYATQNKELPLQRIDVLARPAESGNGSSQVKNIYLQKNYVSGDTLIIKKMLWNARKSFLIVTTTQPHGQPPVVRQVKVVWDASSPAGE